MENRPSQQEEHDREQHALSVIEGRYAEIAQVRRDPIEVLADAKKVALALKAVMDGKPKEQQVTMGGERYLEFEDWSLVATFFGMAVSTPMNECKYIDLGVIEIEPGKPVAVHGFEATAYLIHTRTGEKIAEASMTCLTDEPKWRSKTTYEWVDDNAEAIAGREVQRRGVFDSRDKKEKQKRARVKIGEEAVPLFQLRSMAQTRAASKVCRLNYSWIAVLGGYAPTPAEEINLEAHPVPTGGPVAVEDLTAISEAWGALVKAGDTTKAQRDEIKGLLRTSGYKGAVVKDLWADFATRGSNDVEPIREALKPRGAAAITFADDETKTGSEGTPPAAPAAPAAATPAPAPAPTPTGPVEPLFPPTDVEPEQARKATKAAK